MTFKINPVLAGAILIGLFFLIFSFVKGCKNSKSVVAENAVLRDSINQLSKEYLALQKVNKENLDNYHHSLEYANGLVDLRDNQLQASRADLVAANLRADDLQRRYNSIQPDDDTTHTMVPNEFIEDCSECFDALDNQTKASRILLNKYDSAQSAHRAKESLQQSRINQQQEENRLLSGTLSDCLEAAKRQGDLLEPRGKLYVSMSVLWAPLPSAIGVGLSYQDKRGRMYGAKVYASEWGTIYESGLYFPLSLKKRQ